MSSPIPVAILGFGPADRQALSASLASAGRRVPAYQPVLGVDDARYVVVDADHPEGLALLAALGRVADAVLVSTAASGTVSHPETVDPALVLQRLDAMAHKPASRLVAARPAPPMTAPPVPASPIPAPAIPAPAMPAPLSPAITPAGPADAAAPVPVLPAIPPLAVHTDRSPHPLAPQGERLHSPWHRAQQEVRQRRSAAQPAWVPPRALLVDDSDIALHFLHRHLVRHGVEADFARDSDRALDLLQRQPYGLVFLDLDLGEDSRLDGFELCHQVRHRWCHAGVALPVVVVVSAFHDPVHQVRGTLAGAHAFLGKPLVPAALAQVLGKLSSLQTPAATGSAGGLQLPR